MAYVPAVAGGFTGPTTCPDPVAECAALGSALAAEAALAQALAAAAANAGTHAAQQTDQTA